MADARPRPFVDEFCCRLLKSGQVVADPPQIFHASLDRYDLASNRLAHGLAGRLAAGSQTHDLPNIVKREFKRAEASHEAEQLDVVAAVFAVPGIRPSRFGKHADRLVEPNRRRFHARPTCGLTYLHEQHCRPSSNLKVKSRTWVMSKRRER